MRHNGPVWLALALIVLLGGGPADEKEGDKEKAVKKDWRLLNGTWEVVRAVVDGKDDPDREGATVTLKDGKVTARVGDKVQGEGTFKVDPTTSPRSVDLTATTGPNKGKTSRGIYEVKGDTNRACFAPPGKPRPKAFESKEGSGHVLYTYKRLKTRD
jgi:uncharacterized protein (TIGR03067 family)